MKTKKYIIAAILLVVAVAATVLMGCKKEKLEYSCNPEIDKWAKKNAELFASASREQVAMLPLEYQQAAFRTLSPLRKYRIWKEKMTIIRSNWDEPVQFKIDEILKEFDSSWYVSKQDLEKHVDFIKKWEDDMLRHYLDTTDYVINFYLLATPEEIDVYLNYPETIDYSWVIFPREHSKDVPGGNQSTKTKCMCSTNISCSLFGNGTCTNTECEQTSGGCGLFGAFDCRKDCTYGASVIK